MTLRDELELLRGERIQFPVKSITEIPCVEMSDHKRMCKKPMVSVLMITYNHEHTIARAIESVMVQKTDFEFELIIGEDCSPDQTRDICFEYQKKHPDKIRVLWADVNVNKYCGIAGGNSARIGLRSRGKYVALLEGDDYWIDPCKLQKQVDLMRKTDAVMCTADVEWHYPNGEIALDRRGGESRLINAFDVTNHYTHTSALMFNAQALRACKEKYRDIIVWYDAVLQFFMATMGRVCHLPEVVSVYNWSGGGSGGNPGDYTRLYLDLTQQLEKVWVSPEPYRSFLVRKLLVTISLYLRGSGCRVRDDERLIAALKLIHKHWFDQYPSIRFKLGVVKAIIRAVLKEWLFSVYRKNGALVSINRLRKRISGG